MLVYGRNVAKELLGKNRKIEKIILQENFSDNEIIALIEKSKCPVKTMSKREMDRLADGLQQGIILTIPDYKDKSLGEVLAMDPQFLVLLDHLEDPHNLGSIIRTAETAGVHGIIIPKRRACGVNSTVSKVSAGAVQHMKIARVNNINETIKFLKQNDIWICGTDGQAKTYYFQQDFKMPIAIVIGSEGYGMSRLVKENCDFLVKIPMKGKITSLNASVSAGIVMYEATRQREICV